MSFGAVRIHGATVEVSEAHGGVRVAEVRGMVTPGVWPTLCATICGDRMRPPEALVLDYSRAVLAIAPGSVPHLARDYKTQPVAAIFSKTDAPVWRRVALQHARDGLLRQAFRDREGAIRWAAAEAQVLRATPWS